MPLHSRSNAITINLGTGLATADDFRAALSAATCWIGEQANDLLGSPAFRAAEATAKITLVITSVTDLGFHGFPTYQEICARARELGLELCPSKSARSFGYSTMPSPLYRGSKLLWSPSSTHPAAPSSSQWIRV